MGDYGHDLEFGVFIDPAAGAADQVVALSALAEEAGYDLVTFNDHLYSPRSLDVWTLMSFVAARTGRVRQVRDEAMPVGDARAALNEMALRQNDWTLGAFCARYCSEVTQHHALEGAIDYLADALLSHLAYEEQELVEPLARLGFYLDQVPTRN